MKRGIRETRFENGLVVVTDEMAEVRSATLGFFFRVGSRNESDELNGITHFIEHAVFKGTKRRTALDIAREQDSLGGNFDAFTTHEETGFVIKVIDDKIEQAFELVADMLARPLFDERDLENEQNVIIEEIKMTEDSPEEMLGDIFNAAFFPGHPLGLSIAGTRKTVRTFGRDTTRTYHRKMFTPVNLVVTAAGNVEHEMIVGLAKRAWPETKRKRAAEPLPPKIAAPVAVKRMKHLEQAHLMIATPFVSGRDERRYAADLFANILGGGTSSRLWQKIREDRGLAYSVGASAVMFKDCGFFTVFAGTSPEQAGELIDVAIAEMRDVRRNAVAESELELAKQQTRASILLGLEDSAARAATLAHSEMLHGRTIPVEETLSKIEAVTVDALRELADEFFVTENIAVAALGDLKKADITRSRLKI